MPALALGIRRAYEGRTTQAKLARQLKVAQNTISRWATGAAAPSLDEIARLEDELGLARGYVLRAAGYVEDQRTTEEAIRSDPALDADYSESVLAAYRSSVELSSARRSRIAAAE